jgi:cytochrome c peroxidase
MLVITETVIKEKFMRTPALLIVLFGMSLQVQAETPADFLSSYSSLAKQDNPAFTAPSATRGQQFFIATHGREWSCASCHTKSPASTGKHQITGKTIAPLAPAVNAERFTRTSKVEKWFKRNCGDVLGRACTAQEKGDVLAFLVTLR